MAKDGLPLFRRDGNEILGRVTIGEGMDEDYSYLVIATTKEWTPGCLTVPEDLDFLIACGNALEGCNPDALASLIEFVKWTMEPEGVYSRDRLTHANNTIDNIVRKAGDALAKLKAEWRPDAPVEETDAGQSYFDIAKQLGLTAEEYRELRNLQ